MEEYTIEVPFGSLKIQMDEENRIAWFHAEADKWNKSIYKKSLDVWSDIITVLQGRNYKYIASHIPDDKKIRKFQTMFGLEPHAETPRGLIFRMEI